MYAARPANIGNAIRSFRIDQEIKQSFKEGYEEGTKKGIEWATKMIYAACALTMKDELKFGKDRMLRFMRSLDKCVIDNLSTEEALDEVFDKFGLKFTFNAMEKVEEK